MERFRRQRSLREREECERCYKWQQREEGKPGRQRSGRSRKASCSNIFSPCPLLCRRIFHRLLSPSLSLICPVRQRATVPRESASLVTRDFSTLTLSLTLSLLFFWVCESYCLPPPVAITHSSSLSPLLLISLTSHVP